PYLIKLEHDHDFADDASLHGDAGPTPVKRTSEGDLTAVSRAFVDACVRHGFPEDADRNRPDSIGVGLLPQTQLDGLRVNVAVTSLEPALGRPNLRLLDRATARRVVFDGRTAVGVEVDRDGAVSRYEAGEVVLCASGIKSPHLLLLSGVGPADALRGAGVP